MWGDQGRRRVAVDATPLLGAATGVAAFCAGALGALAIRRDLSMSAYAVTWRRRHLLPPVLPPGVSAVTRAMPARPLHLAWRRTGLPPAEWFIGPVDVVHGTNYVVPPTRHAARVVTVHDLTSLRFPEMCDPPTLVFPELVRRAVGEGAWVHTPSRFVADEVVACLGADPARVRAVAHGVPGLVGSSTDEAPASWPLPEGANRYVLAIGTVEPRKDFPNLVRAFDRLSAGHPDVALVIAGSDGWGADALTNEIERATWRRRIMRTGYVPAPQLSALLAGAAVLAYPSVYEGFGFPPLEAMAAGVPVVATAAGAIPEVVGNGGALVPPGDADELAAALSRVLDDTGIRDALVATGRDRAAEFTWERCAAGLAALYEEATR